MLEISCTPSTIFAMAWSPIIPKQKSATSFQIALTAAQQPLISLSWSKYVSLKVGGSANLLYFLWCAIMAVGANISCMALGWRCFNPAAPSEACKMSGRPSSSLRAATWAKEKSNKDQDCWGDPPKLIEPEGCGAATMGALQSQDRRNSRDLETCKIGGEAVNILNHHEVFFVLSGAAVDHFILLSTELLRRDSRR